MGTHTLRCPSCNGIIREKSGNDVGWAVDYGPKCQECIQNDQLVRELKSSSSSSGSWRSDGGDESSGISCGGVAFLAVFAVFCSGFINCCHGCSNEAKAADWDQIGDEEKTD